MQIKMKGTNMDLTEAIKGHIEEKFSGLEKYFDNIQLIEVEVGKETHGQQKGEIFFCEANVSVPKKLLRYRNAHYDLYAAITEARRGMQNEITQYKEKLRNE